MAGQKFRYALPYDNSSLIQAGYTKKLINLINYTRLSLVFLQFGKLGDVTDVAMCQRTETARSGSSHFNE